MLSHCPALDTIRPWDATAHISPYTDADRLEEAFLLKLLTTMLSPHALWPELFRLGCCNTSARKALLLALEGVGRKAAMHFPGLCRCQRRRSLTLQTSFLQLTCFPVQVQGSPVFPCQSTIPGTASLSSPLSCRNLLYYSNS